MALWLTMSPYSLAPFPNTLQGCLDSKLWLPGIQEMEIGSLIFCQKVDHRADTPNDFHSNTAATYIKAPGPSSVLSGYHTLRPKGIAVAPSGEFCDFPCMHSKSLHGFLSPGRGEIRCVGPKEIDLRKSCQGKPEREKRSAGVS
jgi:hypothetical protein